MTSAATIGPTAAIDAAMELGSPALVMRLGGGVMHMFAFVAWACYRYPTPGGSLDKASERFAAAALDRSLSNGSTADAFSSAASFTRMILL